MDGHAVESELGARAGSTRFELATAQDDADVRRLLRENSMPGRVSISLEREPDTRLAAAVEGDLHQTIIGRDQKDGRVIAMGSVSVRERYLNGQPTRVGYLGQLRLDHSYRPRMSVIRGGYALLRDLHPSLGVRLYLTSIASDNIAARRLLERGLSGMPVYRPLCEFVTLVFHRVRNGEFRKVPSRVRAELRKRGLTLRHGSPELMSDIAQSLDATLSQMQFAPRWSRVDLGSLERYGLRPNHFRIVFESDRALACAAVWDQRDLKQAVLRGYPLALRLARIPLNLISPLTRLPRLPPIGGQLSHAFVSHFVFPLDRPELIEPLIRSLHGSAHSLGVDSLTIGFDARDPRLPIVRRAFGGREYRTQLYVVHWPEDATVASAVEGDRLVAPEVALL
jgi:hypothetical protein